MQLPFTPDQFFDVFAEYNRLFGIAALGWWLAGLAAVTFWRRSRHGGRSVTWFLGVLWLWNSVAYHALLFTRINPAAWLFAVLFAFQAVLFFHAVRRHDLRYFGCQGWRRSAAMLLVVHAFGYPLLTIALVHSYPTAPTFGVPCPTTILTIGLLLSVRGAVPASLVVIPGLWSAVGGSAAILLGVPADYVLLAAGGTLLVCHLERRISVRRASAPPALLSALRPARRCEMLPKMLLVCGILSSFLYVAMTLFIAMQWDDYNSASQAISELSAIDAPTRSLWAVTGALYTLLVSAFGWGVWMSAGGRRALRTAGALILAYGSLGLLWPFAPMHQRDVLAAGGGTVSDTMHLVLASASVLLMLLAIAFAASGFGKRFQWYSIATLAVLVVFGVLTFVDAANLSANLPTPWMGVWERVNIGAFLLWIVVLAARLLKARDAGTIVRHREALAA